MDLGIRGRKAIVNGGSAGLGRAAVRALAGEGVQLFVSARGVQRLFKACEEIRAETGASITPIVADHSTDAGRARILAACPDPDILVGTCSPPDFIADFRQIEAKDWRSTLDVALLSPVMFMKDVIDGMVQRRWGRIVNIASGAAKYPSEARILSGAPRAALVNYSVAVARAVARHNVMINTVLPVMHHTDGIRTVYEAFAAKNGTSYEEEVQKAIDGFPIPAGKFGNADDAGAFVALFCSEFANYTTGQSLMIDGGLSRTTF